MSVKTWTVEKDDSILCQQLTSEYLEEALNMMEQAFIQHENVCKSLGIPKDPEAIAELTELTRSAAKDGVTVIAIDKRNNKVVAAAFNKLQVKDATGESYFENFAKSCKNHRSQAVIQFMSDVDNMCNLFEHCNVDCLLEIMFLGTLPGYGGKGIGRRLCEASIDIGKSLLNGNNVKVSVDGQKLTLEPVPKIASAIFTSFITQKIGKQLGFRIAVEKSFEEFEFEGKTFASVVGSTTKGFTLEYKRLDD